MSIKEMGNLQAPLGYPSPRVTMTNKARRPGLKKDEEQMGLNQTGAFKEQHLKDKKGLGTHSGLGTGDGLMGTYSERQERLAAIIEMMVEKRNEYATQLEFGEDAEGEHNMLKSRLNVIDGRLGELIDMFDIASMQGGKVSMDGWMRDKLTMIADYLSSVTDHAVHGGGMEVEYEIEPEVMIVNQPEGPEAEYKEVKKPEWKNNPQYKKGLSAKDVERAKSASKKAQEAPRKSDESLKPFPTDKEINARRKASGEQVPESPATKAYHAKFPKKEKGSNHREQEVPHMNSDFSEAIGELCYEEPGENKMAFLQGMYGEKKSDKDYDGDGKLESPSEEWKGARDNAIKKRKKAEKLGIDVPHAEGETMDFKKGKSNSGKGLAKKAKESGISLGILRQVYAKGVAAWKTGHRPGMTPQQWAMARVNSFITGSGGARKADKHLWDKHKGVKSKKK